MSVIDNLHKNYLLVTISFSKLVTRELVVQSLYAESLIPHALHTTYTVLDHKTIRPW